MGAPGLDDQASVLDQDIEPQINIRLRLLGVLTHHPDPDQVVRLARCGWPLVHDPPRVLRVLGDAKPAEALASRPAKPKTNARTFALEPR